MTKHQSVPSRRKAVTQLSIMSFTTARRSRTAEGIRKHVTARLPPDDAEVHGIACDACSAEMMPI